MKPTGAHVAFYRMVHTPYGLEGRQQQIEAVLLYKRTQDAPIHPGYWALFGGRLGEHEDTVEGLRREVREELAATTLEDALQNLKQLTDVTIRRGKRTLSISYYKAPLYEDMDTSKLKRFKGKVEGEGLGWFTEEEIHHLWLRPEDREALTRFFKPDAG